MTSTRILRFTAAALGACCFAGAPTADGAETWTGHGAYAPLPAGSVTADGWLKGKLQRVKDGMGGHLDELDPDQFAHPFVRRDFKADLGGKGNVDWCAEMSGEYWLGLVELAFTLDDPALKAKALKWVNGVLALQEKDGYMGAYRPNENRFEDYNAWSCHFAYRALLVAYSATGDRRILDALERGCLWFARNWTGDRKTGYVGVSLLSPACRVAALTGNAEIAAFCRDWARFLDGGGSQRGNPARAWGMAPGGFGTFELWTGGYHLAALGSRACQPLALYLATGDEALLKGAEQAYDNMVRAIGLQPTGAFPGDHEHVARPSCLAESEYCATVFFEEYFQWLLVSTGAAGYADRIERIVFNAGEGARKKDERAMTYLSVPNQLRATLDSSRWGPDPAYGVYAPNVNAACCAANSIRLYSQHLLFSLLSDRAGNLAVAGYLPFRAKAEPRAGVPVEIVSETDYPFSDRVTLRVKAPKGWDGRLKLRRPCWTRACEVRKNGLPADVCADRKGWFVLSGPWKDDVVEVSFGFEPRVDAVRDRDFQGAWQTVAMGPLLFAQPVKERWTERPQLKNAAQLPPDWHWYDLTCAEPPSAYALCGDVPADPRRIAVTRKPMTDDPWRDPPLRLSVPMVRCPDIYPPNACELRHTPWPSSVRVRPPAGAKPEPVELVPFGATCLRLSCFPLAE